MIVKKSEPVGRDKLAPSAVMIEFTYAQLQTIQNTRRMLFFTVSLLERNKTSLFDNIDLFRKSVRITKKRYPFHIDAWVILPDHLHCIWTLPPGDDNFSGRWREIKKSFSKALPKTGHAADGASLSALRAV